MGDISQGPLLNVCLRSLPYDCGIQLGCVYVYLIIRGGDGKLSDHGQDTDKAGQIIFFP